MVGWQRHIQSLIRSFGKTSTAISVTATFSSSSSSSIFRPQCLDYFQASTISRPFSQHLVLFFPNFHLDHMIMSSFLVSIFTLCNLSQGFFSSSNLVADEPTLQSKNEHQTQKPLQQVQYVLKGVTQVRFTASFAYNDPSLDAQFHLTSFVLFLLL